ncbi:TonB-dependent receptor [Emticicia oligotrophica DSM 17448]|uniref:TonB-dependent receptor n=1 Tax=Emticicia oligotrophica (strain DSM 17448 / CIP 109782 / MTCC 6937 / GPTSA100-15) TaxID=929562 RepID=A0ABN4ASJ3_EMTOG|nr:TonB-dependent receptor [Emticicia oligotrophica]AFK05006.1 TonB-dependent receptor [Emticicia oligotrophica DSM 17448]
MMNRFTYSVLMGLLFLSIDLFAQSRTISGTVKDGTGAALPGVTIKIKGGTKGTTTDIDGKYSIGANNNDILQFSAVGVVAQEIPVGNNSTIDITLKNDEKSLNEVVVVGSRATQRSIVDSPLPIDILSSNELKTTGQPTFDKALQYRVPSFNTVNTPVNDATTLLDPYEIRNMGPSRTLILVNGKRKNLSSLLYVQFSPGRGETGVDLSAIPQEAIKRVEILRDGASAQYGSDAIAGVMNVILKDKYEYTSLNINSGVTSKGDGGMYSLALNSGANFAKGGSINYTVNLSQSNSAVRSGKVDLATELATFGGSPAQDALITNYLKDYPTAGNINGTGATTAAKFLINGTVPLGNNNELYANAAMVTKRVLSFANYRTPYWRQDRGLLHSVTDNGGKNYLTKETLAFPEDDVNIYKGYIGYVPTFEGNLLDYNATVGAKGEHGGWKHDASLTVGGNTQDYTVDNTVNRTLGTSSPTRFKPGGYGFSHIVGNIDISKQVSEKLGIALGMEARSEAYTIVAGDEKSYEGEGANSFPGINKENAGTNKRFNIGGYLDLSYDLTKDFLINGTIRSEKYSDFGNATVWKLSSRYKLADDKIILRGSASTGFRAPTLHQIYAQSTQAAFVGGTIQLSGLFNNRSTQARLLGIPALKPEKSTNFTIGVAINPTKNFSITLDYFNIGVKDRIVYSSSISSADANSTLGKILSQAGVRTVQFFINGIQTKTSGLDYVISYRNIALGSGKLGINLAGNVMLQNKIVGTPQEPAAIKAAGSSILNTQIKSLLTESRPKYKAILGFDYQLNKWFFNLTNTLFGPTAFQDLDNGGSDMENIKAEFKPAVVTDLSIGYSFNNKVSMTLNANNLFNVLPKWDLVALNSKGESVLKDAQAKSLLRGFLGFSGRYDILGYNGSQFSQLGTVFNANITIKF